MQANRTLLAAAIKSRDAFDMVSLSGEGAGFSGALSPIWEALTRFYDQDTKATRADVGALGQYVSTGEMNSKHVKQRLDVLAELDAMEVSIANVGAALREASLQRAGHELATCMLAMQDETEIREKLDAYHQLLNHVPGGGEDIADDWRGIISRRADPASRWRTGVERLDESLGGGLLPGHNITLFARPEAGKTALAITMACNFAKDGRRVLYIGNEDPIEDLRLRALTNLVEKPATVLLRHPDKAEMRALERGASNLIMRELCPGTGAEMERLIRVHKPHVLIVDQLRNVRVKGDNFTQQLDKAAQLVRALGKKYKMVTVSVTQAGDSARDKLVLDDGDIDSSNTGIPGAADVLIGMGVDDNMRMAGQRTLTLCKNKVAARHDQINVYLEEHISKIRG